MASSGFEITMTKASGQFVFRFSATLRMILRLMLNRSSRDMPGLRGTPAVMITTSAPAMSSQLEVPLMFDVVAEDRAVLFEVERLALWRRPTFSGMSNRKTSPSSLRAARAASSPPMFPAPMSAIFLRAGMKGPPIGPVN